VATALETSRFWACAEPERRVACVSFPGEAGDKSRLPHSTGHAAKKIVDCSYVHCRVIHARKGKCREPWRLFQPKLAATLVVPTLTSKAHASIRSRSQALLSRLELAFRVHKRTPWLWPGATTWDPASPHTVNSCRVASTRMYFEACRAHSHQGPRRCATYCASSCPGLPGSRKFSFHCLVFQSRSTHRLLRLLTEPDTLGRVGSASRRFTKMDRISMALSGFNVCFAATKRTAFVGYRATSVRGCMSFKHYRACQSPRVASTILAVGPPCPRPCRCTNLIDDFAPERRGVCA